MIRTYYIPEECERLHCDETTIEEAILGELVDEYTPETDYVFNYIDDDTLEVEIIQPEEQDMH